MKAIGSRDCIRHIAEAVAGLQFFADLRAAEFVATLRDKWAGSLPGSRRWPSNRHTSNCALVNGAEQRYRTRYLHLAGLTRVTASLTVSISSIVSIYIGCSLVQSL